MEFKYKSVSATDSDFVGLVRLLNAELSRITNDSGQSSFSSESLNPVIDACLVAYLDDKPVACGVLRYHTSEVCELKRMYSSSKGAGSFLLQLLEKVAAEKGYSSIVLSTRRVNENAVSFYNRHLYNEIKAYGRYVGVSRSICLGKALLT